MIGYCDGIMMMMMMMMTMTMIMMTMMMMMMMMMIKRKYRYTLHRLPNKVYKFDFKIELKKLSFLRRRGRP